MSINLKNEYDDIIYSIEKVSPNPNNKERTHYVFIGEIEDNIYELLKKIENLQSITGTDAKILRNKFQKYINKWAKIASQKKIYKIRFIKNKIQIDDSISNIRKKIFVFISDYEEKEFILPENQQLWVEKSYGKEEIIGYYYENVMTNEKYDLLPSIFKEKKVKINNESKKIQINNEYNEIQININNNSSSKKITKNINVVSDNNYKINTSENNMLIIDLFNILDVVNNTIYFIDAKKQEKYLKDKKENVKNSGIKDFFKTYWPYVNLDYNVEDIKNNYIILKEFFSKESYIFNLIESTPKDKEIYGFCVNTIIINVMNDAKNNTKKNDDNNNINDEYIESINQNDLYQIFDYIRENLIGYNTPYLRYSESILKAPFLLISKNALDNNLLLKENLITWLRLNKEDSKAMNGIEIKRFLKKIADKNVFSTISFKKNMELAISVGFSNEMNAGFEEISSTVENSKKFISELNNIRKIDKKIKINAPLMEYKNGKLIFGNNTKMLFMNISMPLKLNKALNFKKLLDFSLNFPSFLEQYPKEVFNNGGSGGGGSENQLSKIDTSLKLKFKRISNFANMNEILKEIDILKYATPVVSDSKILFILENKFKKSRDELKKYIIEWKRKYQSSKTLKTDPQFKDGIKIIITNDNIKINGITKLYQIPIIYNFFSTFLTLFLNYDDYLQNKEFKKYFKDNYAIFKSGSDQQQLLYNYEVDKNAKLDLDDYQGDGYNFNIDLLSNEEISNINKIYVDEDLEEESQNIVVKKYPGMTPENKMDPQTKLDCKDGDEIVELDTCADFCNDSNYFIRRLQRFDLNLFRYRPDKKNKKQGAYSRGCQSQQQPIVLPYDPTSNPKIDRQSYTYALKYSSDPQLFQRWYICPKVWCPYCEIPISENMIDQKTVQKRKTKDEGGVCVTAKCPFGDHQVFIRVHKETKAYIYPSFLDPGKHPTNLCPPCCFILDYSDPKRSLSKRHQKCLGQDVENKGLKSDQIYILGKGIPIDKDRFAKLNLEIARILNTNLDTGYLENNSGYARKGIKQEYNNSFLSAICDIFICIKETNYSNKLNFDTEKLKKLLNDKLNNDLFLTLHSGNLINIFHNPKMNLSPLQNYKNFLFNKKINIDHKYLWDYLQRPNILYENGINIFIFENNKLLCPFGQNIDYYYDKNKKSIILVKYKEYYEPIYFIEGIGKTSTKNCIFNSDRPEIRELFIIANEGCKSNFKIDWIRVLNDNIKKYDIQIDNITISLGLDLQDLLNELLSSIKNKKLNNGFIPNLQYVDSYNKVFGIKLINNLYIPIKPSPIIINKDIKYKIIYELDEIEQVPLSYYLKLNNELCKNTKIKNSVSHKIYDLKESKYIIAIVNENNRFIPLKKSTDNSLSKKLKVSNLNYYSDVDLSIFDKVELIDQRIEIINKKNFEDETYIRMKFELSKFLILKENKNYLEEINSLINGEIISKSYNIEKKRELMYGILEKIFKNLISIESSKKDFYNYKTPNKRIPCWKRNINKNKNTNNLNLSCDDDPHCIKKGNSCRLYVSRKNLINIHKNFDNYYYYLSILVEELLRFILKRNEILEDRIPTIINKEQIEENPNKYIIIHTLNLSEIKQKIDKIFLDTKGLVIDNRKLYEETTTTYYSFSSQDYLKSNIKQIEDYKLEDLSIFWQKKLGDLFKVKISIDNIISSNIFSIVSYALNTKEFKVYNNKQILVSEIKYKIINYLKKMDSNKILNLYNKTCFKNEKNINSIQTLFNKILDNSYFGCELDLKFIAKIFKINIIILDKRIKSNSIGFKIYRFKEFDKNKSEAQFQNLNNNNNDKYYLILYKSIMYDENFYNLIEYKNKYLFKINEFPSNFLKLIISKENNNKIADNQEKSNKINLEKNK